MSIHPGPRPHTAAQRAATAAQEAEIRGMVARGVDDPTIAAAVGCTIARVQAVTRRPAPQQPPVPPPRPAAAPPGRPATAGRTTGPHGLTVTALLDVAATHDDPRIARHAAHIRNDIAILRDLIADTDHREHLAAELVGLDAHTDRLWAANAARHRRATDKEPRP